MRPWAKSIRLKVANREMPPWGADPRFGTFKDDRSLTPEQIDTIARWVDAGAPKGSETDLPPAPTFASGWSHGEPDVVIEMPVDFEIPAEGQVPVIDFFAKSPFTEDVYVKALEVRPGTPGVVHHAGLYVIDRLPEGARLENGRIVGADGKPMGRNQVARANGGSSTEEIQKLLSFVPGRGYEEYQGDAGQLIKAGSYIDFYMHYTPTGTPQKDRTKVGLYFAKPGQTVGHMIYHSFGAAGPTTYIVEGKEYAPRWRARSDARRGRREPPEHSAVRRELEGRQRPHDSRADHALRPHAASAPARQEHALHADLARRPRRSAARRAEVRLQLADRTTNSPRRRRFQAAAK